MTFPDLLFMILVVALPIAVSAWLFRREPNDRPFLATYALAVMGSSILFGIVSLVFSVAGVGGLGPFDGMFEVIVSLPVALIVGLTIRRNRNRAAL